MKADAEKADALERNFCCMSLKHSMLFNFWSKVVIPIKQTMPPKWFQ